MSNYVITFKTTGFIAASNPSHTASSPSMFNSCSGSSAHSALDTEGAERSGMYEANGAVSVIETSPRLLDGRAMGAAAHRCTGTLDMGIPCVPAPLYRVPPLSESQTASFLERAQEIWTSFWHHTLRKVAVGQCLMPRL